ncbi:MAG: C40 family peptidase [Gammaproteobacteria bacterium]|nr:C40 family peptidase [Gammaproteobacteria bacterium]MDE2346228.1 C40 family peptidase [Gammaproteobacteria bacterium]
MTELSARRPSRRFAAYVPVVAICLGMLMVGCAPWPQRPQPLSPTPAGEQQASRIVRLATAELGVPYRFGGDTPRGFDCSGLVYYVFRHAGVRVPRTANEQLYASHPVSYRDLQPGDLVFFEIAGDAQLHVGIYIGNGEFIHAPETGQSVSIARLDDPYWKTRFDQAGRF